MAKPKGSYTQHPAVYITKEGHPSLLIFLHMFKELTLPKWKKVTDAYFAKKNQNTKVDDHTPSDMTSDEFDAISRVESETFYKANNGEVVSTFNNSARDGYYRAIGKALDYTIQQDVQKSWLSRVFAFLFGGRKKPLDTFEEIKEAMEKVHLPTADEMDKAYKRVVNLIGYLRSVGQIDQARDIANMIEIVVGEKALINHGFTKFITEKEVIDFMLKSDKGVVVDFLRSYRGILPKRVGDIKKKVDDLCIFDNYVVMYFDPSIEKFKFIQERAKEIARRDPILFGVMMGSDRLYYVTDWVTKDDDLTLENLETIIGRKAYDLHNAQVARTNAYHDDLARTMEELEGNILDNIRS